MATTRSSIRLSPLRPRGRGYAPFLLVALAASALALAPAAPAAARGAARLLGVVLGPTGDPVAGATVEIEGQGSARTDESGRFTLDIGPGDWTIRVRHPAYRELARPITVRDAEHEIELRVEWVASVRESITVVGIRAGEGVPVTKRDMDAQEIEALSYGQDVPALLQSTPSMNWYSDSGAGSNYSYFSLRGIQQTRINMTFDGVPLNDPAEHALFFNNFHDFTSAVDTIQIQRGVGTSTVGSPSYGGSVNFASPPPATASSGDARLVLGAYDTQRASVGLRSGPLGDGFSIGGRFSYADTNGYREHSGSEHHTVFFDAGWQDDRSSLRLTGFAGQERSQLSFLAVEPEILRENRRFNPLDEQERDDFGQDVAQLKYTRALDPDTLLTASLYTNGAAGTFYLWDDPVAQNNLLGFGIDQRFWGSMLTLSTTGERVSTTLGLHTNDFSGDHTLNVAESRIYANTGFKRTASGFAKAEVGLGDTLLFGDLGLRWARFRYEGDIDLGAVDWLFLDPRVGVRRYLSDRLSIYASVGRAQREPARLDLLAGEDNATVQHDLEAVRPESVLDFEAGVAYRTPTLTLQANLYAMEFSDEIALTGELSEVGLPLRRNVDRSYRRGLELDLKWIPARRWSVFHSLNLSRNRIREWTQFTDVFDAQGTWLGSVPITYRDVPPLLTPERIGTVGVEYSYGDTSLAVSARHVGGSHLDNTGLEQFRLPSYTSVDLRASLGLEQLVTTGRPRLRVFVNNLFNATDLFPSGYSYQFLTRGADGVDTLGGQSFFYPLATRNVLVALEIDL